MHEKMREAFDWFLANKADLVEEYAGKVVAIRDGRVLGSFDSEIEARDTIAEQFEVGTFLVQRIVADDSAHTMTFRSRVAF
jgi:hypothetical protein